MSVGINSLKTETSDLMKALGVAEKDFTGGTMKARSAISGEPLGMIPEHDERAAKEAVATAQKAFAAWRLVPAPKRGELIRLLGEELRAHKTELGRLVSIEVGKIVSEGLGEVQEMIDICDFAVGLSRQLTGLDRKSVV